MMALSRVTATAVGAVKNTVFSAHGARSFASISGASMAKWTREAPQEMISGDSVTPTPAHVVGIPTVSPPAMHDLSNNATQIRLPAYEPKFWTGTPAVDPNLFTIDCSKYDLAGRVDVLKNGGVSAVSTSLAQEMEDTFRKYGVVVLSNTGIGDDMDAMQRAAATVVKNSMQYKAGANSRGEIAANVFDTGAPKEAWLHYHHEMAYVGSSTRMVAFCCSAAVNDGKGTGSSYISEAQGHTDSILATPLGQKLRELGITYVRCLTDKETGLDDALDNDDSPVYNHWQTSFGVDTPEEAEAIARSTGLEVEWGPNRFMRTKYTVSAFEYCPYTDRNLLYAAVADDSMWFDTWPGVRHLPTMETVDQSHEYTRPLKILFGDGTDFTREELQTFVDVYDAHGVQLDWNKGDIAVVCNHRWAHGRPRFELLPGQRRELGVVLGQTYTRVGQLEEKW